MEKYIITAAFPYTNGYLHIGHLSGVFLPADILVRYLKIKKKKVLFISGSDEHGVPIVIKAKKEKIKEKEIINKYHKSNKYVLKKFKIKLNIFFRTSKKKHHIFCKKVFKKLYEKKFFLIKKKKQYFDKKYKQFLADRYVIGICPICNYKKSYSDQCEKCGNFIKEGSLIKPISILSNTVPIYKKTLNFFINFKKEKKKIFNLIKKFKKNKKIVKYIKNFLKYGLNERSVTRDLEWGVKLPFKKKFKKKVIYVWFEAILGYITSTLNYKKKNLFWKNKKTKLINFIGKDNILFHSIFFPLIIKKYNKKYILPYYINANEFLNLEGKKISTSNNWAIFLRDFLIFFKNKKDVLRFSLIMDMPIKKDTNFTFKKFILYNNSFLIGILGNFINRSLVLIKKKNKNKIPIKKKYLKKIDYKVLKKIKKYHKKIEKNIKKLKFTKSIKIFLKLARIGNKFLSLKKPWKEKNNKKNKSTFYVIFKIILNILFFSYFFLPDTNKKLFKIFNFKKKEKKNFLFKKKYNFLKKNKIKKNKLIFKKLNYKKTIKKFKKFVKTK
ncbi:MAG: methionine--tRNA ligase [Candidatus Shikimatogenerans sp. JK-2022]|nr:methionine--tRNA ligase [Candidatus Shikimatogenerans bostrichidophilus]